MACRWLNSSPCAGGGLVLGAGENDPTVNHDAGDEWWQPMTDEEADAFINGRL